MKSIKVKRMPNGQLEVVQKIRTGEKESLKFYIYLDLEQGLTSAHGQKDEPPTRPMTPGALQFAKKHYEPLAA